MRSALTRDLASWEQGVLSTVELELRHPGAAIGLVALYEQLSDLGDGPVPDAELGWRRLRELLPEHPVAVSGDASRKRALNRRLVSRPLALAASLVLFGATAGYAMAPEAVNRQLASFWESVKDFFGDEPTQDGPARLVEVEQLSVAPPDYVKDEGDLGRHHRSGDDRSRPEGRDDERSGSDEGSGRDSGTVRGSDDDSGRSANIAGGSSDISGGGSGGSGSGSGSGSDSGSDGSGGSDRSGGGDDGSGGDDDGSGAGDGDDDGSGGDDDGDDG